MNISPHWVWIRGLAREGAHWGPFVDDFKKAFPERNLVFLDLPGSGENMDLDPGLSLPAMIPLLREQLHKKIGTQKFNLFCMSLGAMLGMEWMNQYPDDVVSSVFINPSSREHSAFHARLSLGAYPKIVNALTASSSRKREMAVLELVSNRPEIYKEVAADWVKISKTRPMKVLTVLKQLAAGARYSPPKNFKASTPVLVLVSLGDRMVEPQCSFDLVRAYGWEVKSHPWAGHDLTLDAPEWVINALSQWSFSVN